MSTPVATTASVNVEGSESWSVDFDDAATDHELPLVGFKADQHYDVSVLLTAEDGETFTTRDPLNVDTPSLPDGFPEILLVTSMPERMQPGHTLFTTRMSGNYQLIVDERGEVIWYYEAPGTKWDIRELPDGQLLLHDAGAVVVMDLLGNESVRIEPEGAEYHHAVSPSHSGTFWTLGNRTVMADAFPTNYDDLSRLEAVEITDDTLVELDPEAGVVQSIFLRDVLDPLRIGYDSLNAHPENGTPRDWAHSNAIIEVDDGENLIVSCRHQDTVFKMKRDGSELVWILANHDNWSDDFVPYLLEPVGEGFRWPYHQHAPEITPDGTLLLFDNSNYRASPSDGREVVEDLDNESRVVEFRIDETERTIETVWEYTYQRERWFSGVVGDADLQPETNNVLINFGALYFVEGVTSREMGRGNLQARVIEVDRDADDEVVFEIEVYASDPDGPGYFVYRAERIPAIR